MRGSHTPRLNSATIWTLLPRCSMPWRKDGRCELWDPETSLVMEASEGEMGERRGRLRCQLLAAPLCRCCWTPARVRRASSPEMSTRLSLQTASSPPSLPLSERVRVRLVGGLVAVNTHRAAPLRGPEGRGFGSGHDFSIILPVVPSGARRVCWWENRCN